jgi:large subunit ribosomal protein L23
MTVKHYTTYSVIKRQIVTEKAHIGITANKYTFEVAPKATKYDVKKALEALYGVTVEKVNIINQVGKVKRFKGRIGKRSDVKKAIVTLSNESKLDLVGGSE